nr:oligosaccharide flippase family protein [uncultured Treponema sp.]
MNISKSIARNSSISLISQILTLILSLINRTLFVKYIGVELLGVSSTITSLVATLSLTELGFQTAVVYRLYSPLAHKNYELCNKILSIFNFIYKIISIVIFILLLCFIPLLQFVLKGVELTYQTYIIFFLIGLTSLISYFFAHKRTLLYADKKDPLSKMVDTISNLIFTGIKIVIVIYTKSIYWYLILSAIQSIIANGILYLFCNKLYPWMKVLPIDRCLLKEMFLDVRNIFLSKIAGYIYSSTDNLIISIFIGTVSVGLYSNYVMIVAALKILVDSISGQIAPFIGASYANDKNTDRNLNILNLYTFVKFILAGLVTIPLFVLIDSFIGFWLGNDFIIPLIKYLIVVDLYIYFIYGPLSDYVTIAGYFNYSKTISLVSAICNIILSLIFVNLLGIKGVLIGTVFSQLITWILFVVLVFKRMFYAKSREVCLYVLKNLCYLLQISVLCFVCTIIHEKLLMLPYVCNFLITGCICEVLFIFTTGFLYLKTNESIFVRRKILK